MTSEIEQTGKGNYLKIKNFIKVRQGEGVGDFIVCTVRPKDLIRAVQNFPRKYNDEGNNYIGIQRELKEDKLNEIKDYVKRDSEACFPNSVILNLDTSFLIEESDKELKIELEREEDGEIKKGIFVIDGQHRLYAFEDKDLSENFELIIVLFKGLEQWQQAYLFSTINNKQQRLNPSQVQDLNEILKIETPEKIVHRLTRVFNEEENSPWKDDINILGGKIERKGKKIYGVMSQYSFAKEILNLIYNTKKYFLVRNYIKNLGGREKLSLIDGLKQFESKYPFWKYYIKKEDSLMMSILYNYFNSIKTIFEKDWEDDSKILKKTTGYIAFMKLLKRISLDEGEKIKDYNFTKLMQEIKKKNLNFTNKNFPAGAKGQSELFKEISLVYENLKS